MADVSVTARWSRDRQVWTCHVSKSAVHHHVWHDLDASLPPEERGGLFTPGYRLRTDQAHQAVREHIAQRFDVPIDVISFETLC